MALLLSVHPTATRQRMYMIEALPGAERKRYYVALGEIKEKIQRDALVKGGKKHEAYLSCGMILQELALQRAFQKWTDPPPILNWCAFYDPPVIPVTDVNLDQVFRIQEVCSKSI